MNCASAETNYSTYGYLCFSYFSTALIPSVLPDLLLPPLNRLILTPFLLPSLPPSDPAEETYLLFQLP